jgi:hypothetical protein
MAHFGQMWNDFSGPGNPVPKTPVSAQFGQVFPGAKIFAKIRGFGPFRAVWAHCNAAIATPIKHARARTRRPALPRLGCPTLPRAIPRPEIVAYKPNMAWGPPCNRLWTCYGHAGVEVSLMRQPWILLDFPRMPATLAPLLLSCDAHACCRGRGDGCRCYRKDLLMLNLRFLPSCTPTVILPVSKPSCFLTRPQLLIRR